MIVTWLLPAPTYLLYSTIIGRHVQLAHVLAARTCCKSAYMNTHVNPGVRWLHFEVFSAIQVQPTFLISDIRALWCSGLSARVPECQKLKMYVRPGWHDISAL